MKWLFSQRSFLAISIVMMVAGITLDVLAWLHVIAQNEPKLVVHLSTAALYFSGYGNVIIAAVKQDTKSE